MSKVKVTTGAYILGKTVWKFSSYSLHMTFYTCRNMVLPDWMLELMGGEYQRIDIDTPEILE